MKGEKQIRAALPHLAERELWFVELDSHRAADAAAIGGASNAQWQEYVTMENDVKKERERRFPDSRCPFPRALVDGWTDGELDEMKQLYKRIFSGSTAESGAER